MDNIREMLDAGASLANHQLIVQNGIPYTVVPAEYKIESLEHTLSAPTRKRGDIVLCDAKSFIAYFNKHKSTANGKASAIYGRTNPPAFLALMDDHGEEPGWREHKVTYRCPLSVEWQTWVSKNAAPMSQAQFAEFIESNLPDIVTPPGSDMLEISRNLEAKKKVSFASGIRLSNGQTELTYEEEIQGTAAKGKLSIPEIFALGIPVLENGERYKVEARLRYRINEGRLSMWYDLIRPHKVLEDAVMNVWKEIASQTSEEILNGDPLA
jgi:uncharacterized protein YfdQ (DUF2303 family)